MDVVQTVVYFLPARATAKLIGRKATLISGAKPIREYSRTPPAFRFSPAKVTHWNFAHSRTTINGRKTVEIPASGISDSQLLTQGVVADR